MQQLTNPITGFAITIMSPDPNGDLLGWIELRNGTKDAGYIYFSDTPPFPPPHLSFEKTYIVMTLRWSSYANVVTLLQTVKPLQIRFVDPETAGVPPSAFLESASEGTRTALSPNLSKEEAEFVSGLRFRTF